MMFVMFYIERWMASCQGLTHRQKSLYLGLLLWCYTNESPLPLDRKECARIADARTGSELEDIGFLLTKFFQETSGGWRNKRVEIELGKYSAKKPGRENQKADAAMRKKRSREQQRQLYADAREKGLPVRAGMTFTELRELLGMPAFDGRFGAESPEKNGDVSHGDASQSHTVASYVPVTSNQYRDRPRDVLFVTDQKNASFFEIENHSVDPIAEQKMVDPNRVGSAIRAMRSGGVIGVNGGHPLLLAMLDAGVSDEALAFAAASAAAKGKGFAYALAIAEGQMRDAAQASAGGLKPGAPLDRREAEARAWVASVAPGLEAKS
jgi:uncharacterized protein YdaU (DUF1376 family)